MPAHASRFRLATCQFSESFQPLRNATIIRRYIKRAKQQDADVIHFHECALSGYGKPVGTDGYDWNILHDAMESILAEAAKQKIWVVLGNSHRLSGTNKPHNSLYLISPEGEVADRYDKRFCTHRDMETYTPGNRFAVFTLNGIKCGMLICYDSRFPELYRELYKLKVRVVFHSFHNAGAAGPGILTRVMRPTIQCHAGTNAMWISAPNSSKHYSLWPSVFVTPDGQIAAQLPANRAGLMVNTVDATTEYYDASKPFRDRAIAGKLNSGREVVDPRSADRKCY